MCMMSYDFYLCPEIKTLMYSPRVADTMSCLSMLEYGLWRFFFVKNNKQN